MSRFIRIILKITSINTIQTNIELILLAKKGVFKIVGSNQDFLTVESYEIRPY